MDPWIWLGQGRHVCRVKPLEECFQHISLQHHCLGKGKVSWAEAGGLIRAWCPAETNTY